MLDFLFARLTADGDRGAKPFDRLVAIARQPGFYRDCAVPDTLEGRFAVLATVTALLMVRLEREDDGGNAVSVAITERFIAAMEAEHRELGLGDPALGKKVRRLVGALARRVELWRNARPGTAGWEEAVRDSLFGDAVSGEVLSVAAARLLAIRAQFESAGLESIVDGEFG